MSDERLIRSIPHRPDLEKPKANGGLLSEVDAVLEAPAARDDNDPRPIEDRVVDIIKTIFDPEIPVNIYELGLIYEVKVEDGDRVNVQMTLTSPACPVAGSLPGEVEQKVRSVPGVADASVELTWDPPWTPDKMSEEAKLLLNLPY
ncbi:MAG: SUF system Fe-S cluster assembly protein [Myxococcota bacterium]